MTDESYDAKAGAYRQFGTGLVAAAVMQQLPQGGSLLDVGCASGGLMALARERAGELVGLEISHVAAASAEQVADRVIRLPLDAPDIPIEPASFDVVACADVLEHTVDPLAGLRRAATWVRPGGSVVVSVPNIAHWTARMKIIRGRWDYEDTGIFDSGHLRFFTPGTIEQLVSAAGLDIERVEVVVPSLRSSVPMLERLPRRARRRLESAWQRVGRRTPSLLGYQTVVVARRPVG